MTEEWLKGESASEPPDLYAIVAQARAMVEALLEGNYLHLDGGPQNVLVDDDSVLDNLIVWLDEEFEVLLDSHQSLARRRDAPDLLALIDELFPPDEFSTDFEQPPRVRPRYQRHYRPSAE